MHFSGFDLNDKLIKILDDQNIVSPTPIQERAVPVMLKGGDVVGIAQTGTGKTLAFALPAVERLSQSKAKLNAMLVLTPTRELAVQVHKVIAPLAEGVGLSSVVIYGGVSLERQAQKLSKGRTIIVATPGRLIDHMHRGNLRFKKLQVAVLDEADRMLDMGFFPDVRRIMNKLPRERQTVMFSATFPSEIERLASEFMHDPQKITVGEVFKPVEKVRQWIYPVNPHDKDWLLMKVLDEEKNIDSMLVFCRTKRRTESLARQLRKKKYQVAAIHGDRTQAQREKALSGFRKGKYQVLIATDVAARGLDIDGISHVINFDIPPNADDYIHRVGRTARADSEGDAVTFVAPSEWKELEGIEKRLGINIRRRDWERAPDVISMYTPKVEKPETVKRVKGRPVLRGSSARPPAGRRRRR
jgi:ATP-dependent RNA helicase RhlE